MASNGLQLADVPVLPVASRIPQMEDGYGNAVNDFNKLMDVPVQQAKRKADIAKSNLEFQQSSGAAKRAKNMNALMPEDSSDIDAALVDQYVRNFGRPPVDATGKIDRDKVSLRVEKAQDTQRRIMESQANEKGRKITESVIDDSQGHPHRWLKVIDLDGTVVTEKDLGIDSKTISERLHQSASQTKAATDQAQELVNLKDTLSQVREAKELTKPGAPDVVGPVAGNFGTKFVQQARSALGNDSAKDFLNRQAKLRFLVSDLVLNNASKLKGSLSDKDIAFLKASVPKDTDDNVTWQGYLTRFENVLNQRQAAISSSAPTAATMGASAPAAAPAAAPSAAPAAAPAPAASNDLQEGEKIFRHPSDSTKVIIQKLDGSQVEVTREQAAAMAQARASRRQVAPTVLPGVKFNEAQ